MTEPTVTAVPAQHRYQIDVDGTTAGFAAYADTDTQRIFYDTQIDGAFGGRGLGTALIAGALEDTRAAGKRIVPVCSFVAGYLEKHADYAGLVDPVTAQARAVAEAQSG